MKRYFMNILRNLLLVLLSVAVAGCGSKQSERDNQVNAAEANSTALGIVPHVFDAPSTNKVSDNSMVTIEVTKDESDYGYEYYEPDTNLYDISFDDTPLLEVVRQFTQVIGANVMCRPSELPGRCNVNLYGVKWRPALESILNMHDLCLIEKTPGSQVYTILRRTDYAEPYVTKELFFETETQAIQIASAVKEVWGGNPTIKIAAVPAYKTVIIKGTRADHQGIKQSIDNILKRQKALELKKPEEKTPAVAK